MNEKNNLALVTRPPRALEKAEPGAKRILSGMVADTLALAPATDAEAIFQRGRNLYYGKGGSCDYVAAARCFHEAAERGHVWART